MKRIMILCGFLMCFTYCKSQEQYKNITSNNEDITFYNLKTFTPLFAYNATYKNGNLIKDSIKIVISIPNDLQKVEVENNIFQYQKIDVENKSGYMISLEKHKSKNTIKFESDKEYIDLMKKGKDNGVLKGPDRMFPLFMKDVKVVSLDCDLMINSKYFMRRILYYIDSRLDGTPLEGVNTTEFQFITLHNKSKYSLNIVYYGDDKGMGDLISLFNTIGGSLKFE